MGYCNVNFQGIRLRIGATPVLTLNAKCENDFGLLSELCDSTTFIFRTGLLPMTQRWLTDKFNI